MSIVYHWYKNTSVGLRTKVTFSMPCVMSARPELPGTMSDVSGSIAILQSRHIPTPKHKHSEISQNNCAPD